LEWVLAAGRLSGSLQVIQREWARTVYATYLHIGYLGFSSELFGATIAQAQQMIVANITTVAGCLL